MSELEEIFQAKELTVPLAEGIVVKVQKLRVSNFHLAEALIAVAAPVLADILEEGPTGESVEMETASAIGRVLGSVLDGGSSQDKYMALMKQTMLSAKPIDFGGLSYLELVKLTVGLVEANADFFFLRLPKTIRSKLAQLAGAAAGTNLSNGSSVTAGVLGK